MLSRVLNAPVNLYFDVTPIGRILNKFSKDLNEIESEMSYMLGTAYAMIFILLQSLVVAIIALP